MQVNDADATGAMVEHKVSQETVVIKGKVLVTRNPCYHPGDVRILEAVEPHPDIAHLKVRGQSPSSSLSWCIPCVAGAPE